MQNARQSTNGQRPEHIFGWQARSAVRDKHNVVTEALELVTHLEKRSLRLQTDTRDVHVRRY
jgi:hypothetical protein